MAPSMHSITFDTDKPTSSPTVSKHVVMPHRLSLTEAGGPTPGSQRISSSGMLGAVGPVARSVPSQAALARHRSATNNPGFSGVDLRHLATKHEQVTILFTDICGFTDMSKQVEPVEVMHFLNCLYSRYDLLLNEWGVYKVRPGGQGGGGWFYNLLLNEWGVYKVRPGSRSKAGKA